jgi:hypothetical protein
MEKKDTIVPNSNAEKKEGTNKNKLPISLKSFQSMHYIVV